MPQYELLYILPGTMTEDEAKPVMAKVEASLNAAGVTGVTSEHGGKNRLSYAMRHIRYGWFELVYFSAEPKVAPLVEAKLRLLPELLRVVVRQQTDGAIRHLQNSFVPITREQGRFEERRAEPYLAPAMASAPAVTATSTHGVTPESAVP